MFARKRNVRRPHKNAFIFKCCAHVYIYTYIYMYGYKFTLYTHARLRENCRRLQYASQHSKLHIYTLTGRTYKLRAVSKLIHSECLCTVARMRTGGHFFGAPQKQRKRERESTSCIALHKRAYKTAKCTHSQQN